MGIWQFGNRDGAKATYRYARERGFSRRSAFRYAIAEFGLDDDIRILARLWVRSNTNLLR